MEAAFISPENCSIINYYFALSKCLGIRMRSPVIGSDVYRFGDSLSIIAASKKAFGRRNIFYIVKK